MHIFSSSTRNQHPNHGVVAGAEKPRRRKKETPATATSSENQVYCCGQPTIAGFEAAINKACGTIYPNEGKILWLNM